ncbi:hypothetical protein Q1695_006006 [Nippostrongylus brasiliensis]|nr:hypothetical protein Q1695_006006 [Nippostrongylus brasiliensis]
MISLVTFSSSLVPLQVTPRLSLLKMQDSGNRTMLSLCSYHFTHHTLHFFLNQQTELGRFGGRVGPCWPHCLSTALTREFYFHETHDP